MSMSDDEIRDRIRDAYAAEQLAAPVEDIARRTRWPWWLPPWRRLLASLLAASGLYLVWIGCWLVLQANGVHVPLWVSALVGLGCGVLGGRLVPKGCR